MKKYNLSALLLSTSLVLASCTAADVPQQEVGARPDQSTDEAGLWQIMDRQEERQKTAASLERSPELNAYVKDIVCRIAAEYCSDVRVYVMNIPYFNASMAPNGMTTVWSGLLLRAENEAQFAYVMGHELAHYVERHSLEQQRTITNTASAAMFLGMGVGVAGIPLVGTAVQLAALSTIFGFSRDKEREADDLGYDYLVRAGYDGRSAAEIWKTLVEEVDHSDNEERKKRQARASLFATHPLTSERIETLEEKAQSAQGGQTGYDRFRAAVAPHLSDWLRAELRLKDFGASLYVIDRLIGYGDQLGVLNYYKGEAYRLRRGDGDEARALTAYNKASAFADAPPETWRDMGQIYMRQDRGVQAKSAFENYLEKAPAAKDRMLIESYIQQLGGSA